MMRIVEEKAAVSINALARCAPDALAPF